MKLMEQNLEILYQILSDGPNGKLSQILSEEHYDFYLVHLFNYLDCYDPEQSKSGLLLKVSRTLQSIANYVLITHAQTRKKRDTGISIFWAIFKLLLKDHIYLATLDSGSIIKIAFQLLEACRPYFEAAHTRKLFNSISNSLRTISPNPQPA